MAGKRTKKCSSRVRRRPALSLGSETAYRTPRTAFPSDIARAVSRVTWKRQAPSRSQALHLRLRFGPRRGASLLVPFGTHSQSTTRRGGLRRSPSRSGRDGCALRVRTPESARGRRRRESGNGLVEPETEGAGGRRLSGARRMNEPVLCKKKFGSSGAEAHGDRPAAL
jgi:hypothetical protein